MYIVRMRDDCGSINEVELGSDAPSVRDIHNLIEDWCIATDRPTPEPTYGLSDSPSTSYKTQFAVEMVG
jgi:hypothetical protein